MENGGDLRAKALLDGRGAPAGMRDAPGIRDFGAEAGISPSSLLFFFIRGRSATEVGAGSTPVVFGSCTSCFVGSFVSALVLGVDSLLFFAGGTFVTSRVVDKASLIGDGSRDLFLDADPFLVAALSCLRALET